MATIDDVASEAGVSIKTVSRVLNNEPHVRPALRERVVAAVEKLSYRPNQSARRLAGKRSFLIAYLYSTPRASYAAAIQTAAALRCRELGYHLVIEPIDTAGPVQIDVFDRLARVLQPDGVFLTPPLSDDAELIEHLREIGLKVCRISGIEGPYGINIETDEKAAGELATRHLLAIGHRRIAVVTPPAAHRAAGDRVEGYRAALRREGGDLDPQLEVQGDFRFASGLSAGRTLLKLPKRPSAIFATNDEMALGLMAAAHELNLSVPDDLSIVGFDDSPSAQSAWPALTTIRPPLAELGAAAVDALVSGELPQVGSFRHRLIVRNSTAERKG